MQNTKAQCGGNDRRNPPIKANAIAQFDVDVDRKAETILERMLIRLRYEDLKNVGREF